MNEIAVATEDLANRYFNQCNYEIPLFHTQYIINSVDPYLFNGHPPRPTEATLVNGETISSIKLKDMFHNDRVIKSKQSIQELF